MNAKTSLKMPRWRQLTITDAVRCISTASLLTAATVRAQDTPVRTIDEVLGEPFSSFLLRVSSSPSGEIPGLIKPALEKIRASGNALVTDSTVHFLYSGPGRDVSVPSDLNGWNTKLDPMTRVPGTNVFHLTKRLPRAARFEYKLLVDSSWILDPANTRVTMGGYGHNSEVWMPGYVPPADIREREGVARGRLDTLLFRSDTLGRTHPVMVYVPSGFPADGSQELDCIWVLDGGEYLSLGLMNVVLDNLIHDRRIRPVVGVFVDPRTNPADAETSRRMEDYALNKKFLNFLVQELRPRIMREYSIRNAPQVIMGASLGGLCATYAATMHPDIFGGAAAQSPAFWWHDRAIFELVRKRKPVKVQYYLDTGTIQDARAETLAMKALLQEIGCSVSYAEYPEGHNWVNWRARTDDILRFFFGKNQ